MLLKCPPDSQVHNCYHPGYRYKVSGIDSDFQPLSKDCHTIEDVSAAAWNYPLPAIPVKKTLVVRDQDEMEIQTFWGAEITDTQVSEILDATGYKWRERSIGNFLLCSEGAIRNQDGCWAELKYLENEEWTGGVIHEGNELHEEFASIEEARGWCERHTAMLLLHL